MRLEYKQASRLPPPDSCGSEVKRIGHTNTPLVETDCFTPIRVNFFFLVIEL